ncbi:hypothetical protein [Thermus sp.]|uniref:hypothetical protein n=1 Tax=Thermus sp. TaxID=275 RepID=UPI0025EF2770|nr:hypothetical protein [Thermus sp.]MCS6868962.1 hypothetical protein [Thermus sp.]
MNLVHVPKPRTPYGVPTRVELWEGPHAPWRTLLLGGVEAPVGGRVEVELQGPLFQGEVRGRTAPLERVCWGLPEWRRPVPPMAFSDATAQDVIGYIAAQVGGRFQERLPRDRRRHYVLPRVAAHEGVRMVLQAWGYEATLHELDGGVLYIGSEGESPHRAVAHTLREEVAEVRPLGGAVYLKAAPLPSLRRLNRLRHPGGEGVVAEHRLVLSPEEAFHEVILV